MIPLIENIFLDSLSLRNYLQGKKVDISDVRRRLTIIKRKEHYSIPDHQIDGAASFMSNHYKTLGDLLWKLPYELAHECLCEHNGCLMIRQEYTEMWFELISKISPTYLIAGWFLDEYEKNNLRSGDFKHFVNRRISEQFQCSALLSPYIPELENFVRMESGLFDLHLHLNGTVESEALWIASIGNPDRGMGKFRMTIDEESTKKQIEQTIPELSIELFETCLRKSLKYRKNLIDCVSHLYYPRAGRIDKIEDLWGGCDDEPIYNEFVTEILFNILVMSMLRQRKYIGIEWQYHFYLLTKGLFNALSVQQTTQYGFDQFQCISDNGIRDIVKKNYTKVFLQLSGHPKRKLLNQLEGRFPPQMSAEENRLYVKNIVSDFERFKKRSGPNKDLELSLVAHFIKRKYPVDYKTEIRNKALRLDLSKRANALLRYKKTDTTNSRYVVGIDAAANEMNAAPEVFAPIFHQVRKSGLFKFTYHVGEDFRHLLSGIRAIDEAIEFLEMQRGDRLGHCTALGISPTLWIERSSREVFIPRGEWLDNLVWMWNIINSEKLCSDFHYLLPRIGCDIMRYSSEIYGEARTPIDLYIAWTYRKYDPLVYLDPYRHYNDDMKVSYDEWKCISRMFIENKMQRNLYLHYHSVKQSRRRYDEYIEVDNSEAYVNIELLTALQDVVLKKIVKKGIVIETLPTSNYRISQYSDFSEYHIERWTDEGKDYNPLLVIGTDDPGIFSTNIFNEYSRVFLYWKAKNYSEGAIMRKIRDIHQNSKIYSFHAKY